MIRLVQYRLFSSPWRTPGYLLALLLAGILAPSVFAGDSEALSDRLQTAPLGLPPLQVPADNLQTQARVSLGRKLFFDRRLSFNGTLSCGMCHVPEQAFTQNELRTSVGTEGRFVKRNAPTLINVAYQRQLFHDGRETSLEHQVWQPLLKANEMANPSIGRVLEFIRETEDYSGLFEAAYGSAVTMASVGKALASYQRSLLLADSAFDRWQFEGDERAVSGAARRGWEVFKTTGCVSCHSVEKDYALFSDGLFHDTGIGYARSMGLPVAQQDVELVPGLKVAPGVSFESPRFNDLGRYEATGRSEDRWRYRTPSLRNVALTAPYMHDGSLADLKSVIRYYSSGGSSAPDQDPRIRALDLSPADMQDIEAFLQSLTGNGLAELQADARRAAIGDIR